MSGIVAHFMILLSLRVFHVYTHSLNRKRCHSVIDIVHKYDFVFVHFPYRDKEKKLRKGAKKLNEKSFYVRFLRKIITGR